MPATYQHFSELFPGLEFDWFAQDSEGNIGLFSTGGLGPVPLTVQSHFQSHDSAALSIDLPHLGSLDVWKDFARHGLYVFDWQPHAGPYRKMKQPEGQMQSAFQYQILHIVGLPLFDGLFRQMKALI